MNSRTKNIQNNSSDYTIIKLQKMTYKNLKKIVVNLKYQIV